MEQFLKGLDQLFASGQELSNYAMAMKRYRVLAQTGLGNPLVEAGEKLLFGVSNKSSGQLMVPKFTTDLAILRQAAVMFGQAVWYICRRYGISGREIADSDACGLVTAHTNMILTFVEIAKHPDTPMEERFFCINAALVHISNSDIGKETFDKVLELRNAMFPNALPFVQLPLEEYAMCFPFDPAKLPEITITDRPWVQKTTSL